MSEPTVRNFDPGALITTIGAFPLTSGFAPGTFIKVSRMNDTFKSEAGAQGDVVRTRSRDRRGTVELTLLRTAQANDYLSGLAAADEQFGTGIRPLTMKDLNGTTVVFGAECWLKKVADVEESVDGSTRTWTFECAAIEIFVGGNLV